VGFQVLLVKRHAIVSHQAHSEQHRAYGGHLNARAKGDLGKGLSDLSSLTSESATWLAQPNCNRFTTKTTTATSTITAILERSRRRKPSKKSLRRICDRPHQDNQGRTEYPNISTGITPDHTGNDAYSLSREGAPKGWSTVLVTALGSWR
jgi:hypothetical protein